MVRHACGDCGTAYEPTVETCPNGCAAAAVYYGPRGARERRDELGDERHAED